MKQSRLCVTFPFPGQHDAGFRPVPATEVNQLRVLLAVHEKSGKANGHMLGYKASLSHLPSLCIQCTPPTLVVMEEGIEQPPLSILIWAFGLSRNFFLLHREAQ